MAVSTLVGVKRVQDAMNRKLAQVAAGAGTKSMVRAAAMAIRDAVKETPVMTGELRQKNFIEVRKTGNRRIREVAFGFHGPYAFKTHENPRSGRTGGVSPKGRRYKKWARKGRAFFLLRAFRKNRRRMLAVMLKGAKDGLGKRIGTRAAIARGGKPAWKR